MEDLLVRAARGERTERPPVWLMRQAGRHLPEYRALRREYSFREAIETPAIAAEITLQPWHRYRPDGLVIFSDILPVLDPLGFEYRVESDVGPVIDDPIEGPGDVPTGHRPVADRLGFVGDLFELLLDRVGDDVPLIGFAGGPVTLASYLVAGRSTRDHFAIRRFRTEHPTAFRSLLEAIGDAVHDHLTYQIDSGADVVQLFDTYAGHLPPADYREFVLPVHSRIFEDLSVPSIIFARGMGGRLDLLAEAGADVVGFDWTVDIARGRAAVDPLAVQGNLDPAALFAPTDAIRSRTHEIIDRAGPSGHILNLGHGVHQETPVEAVEAFVEAAKSIDR